MSGQAIGCRWLVVLGAVLMQLSLGAIYAWSVFTPSLIEAGWSRLDTQLVFSAGLGSFSIAMLFAGKLLKRIGPRKLAVAGGTILGLGYVLAGLMGVVHFWVAFVFVGLMGGFGIGLAYVVPIAVGIRWFPDHKGMITGLAVAGFGFGALGWVKLAGDWGNLIARFDLSITFIIYGLAFMVLIFTGAIWMVLPRGNWQPKNKAWRQDGAKGGHNFTLAEMLHTPQFYMLFLVFAVSAGAGLMSVGLMKLYPTEALIAHGFAPDRASAIAGTALAVFFSLANGLGRILWGVLSDRLGRQQSVLILTASQSVFLSAFPFVAGTPWMLFCIAVLIGFNFGGNFALFPALTADLFGNEKVGQNYPWVFMSSGVGGIIFPVLGGMLGDMHNFPLAFSITAGACLSAAFVTALIRSPRPVTRTLRMPALPAPAMKHRHAVVS